MSSARAAILDRVRRAQRTALIPPHDHAEGHGGAVAQRTGELVFASGAGAADGGRARAAAAPVAGAAGSGLAATPPLADALSRFLVELTTLGVEHHVEPSADAVRARVRAIVGDQRVLAWDLSRLPYDAGTVLTAAATGASPRDVQAAAEIGVTGCDAAIAETGSLVMLSGPDKPRAASLLPPVHVCIVRAGDLRFTMGRFFEERAADVAAAACCTFISGPSRTADIELTLTLGVHGPGKVVVVVGP